MKIDTEGTYTLTYTATDSCGNSTSENRTVVVASPRTVLYTDGTLIINEQPKDRASNETLHGAATNVYEPMNSDGSNYRFGYESRVLWYSVRTSINRVEVGDYISPTSMQYWFESMISATSMDLTKVNTSRVTNMSELFNNCRRLETLTKQFNTSNVTNMSKMFATCEKIQQLDLSEFNTAEVTNMSRMFSSCSKAQSINMSSFDTRKVTTMEAMFANTDNLTQIDIGSFSTPLLTNTNGMFYSCDKLATIYASPLFDVSNVADSTTMFANSSHIVGGAGTTVGGNPTDKTYARIDNPPDAPGYFTAKE